MGPELRLNQKYACIEICDDMQHAIKKQAVISGWAGPTSTFRRKKQTNYRPFLIHQIASGRAHSATLPSLRQPVNQILLHTDRCFVNAA
ncbi:hypothetical protein AD943_03915 [Gluconobacter roseus]|nr:hypothetical protein AD943_03915 [Gluconobacter roseus]